MTLDLTRRSFLKGAMAAAAVVAVVPAFLVPAETAAAEALPRAERADLWLRVDGEWRFIGKVLSAHIRPEERRVPEIVLPPHRAVPSWMYGLEEPLRTIGDMSICVDPNGRDMLHAAFMARDGVGIGIGIGTLRGPAIFDRAIIMRHKIEISESVPLLVDHIEFEVSGEGVFRP